MSSPPPPQRNATPAAGHSLDMVIAELKRSIRQDWRPTMKRVAIACAQEIGALNNKVARWVASDALGELRSPAVQTRLAR